VYAYEGELEAWRKERVSQLQRQPPIAAPSHRSRFLWAAAAALAVAAGAAWWLTRPSILPFEQRDWALIAKFENHTGEDVFDGTVEHALEREISNSRFVNVVPRERISDSLRLMKKPPATIVDAVVAREVCVRDGGIRALITGRVEKLDSTYVVSAALVNPATGVTVASFSERALGQREAVTAIQRLSNRVREGLGEELASIGQETQKLEKVSTPSLRALQLYSHADGLIKAHRHEQAAELLGETIREDPEFASAHVLLAHVLGNMGRREEAGAQYAKALELSKSSTDAERLFIVASHNQQFLRDHHKGVRTLELLTRLYPDHYWANSNLALGYHAIGQPQRATPYTVRRADLRPHNFDHQLRAAHALVISGDSKAAERYVERARRVIEAEEDDPARRWRAAWLQLYPAHTKWVERNFDGAIEEAAKLAGASQDPMKWELGSLHLSLGRLGTARTFFQSMTGPHDYLALIALGLDDMESVRKHLSTAHPSHRAAILMARAGLIADAEKALADPQTVGPAYAPFLPGVWATLARGELALARGRTAEAIPLLEDAVQTLRAWPTPYFFLGAEALARAWQQQGDLNRSLAVLEDAAEYGKASIFWGPAPLFWMKNELRRAELYRRLGRTADSERVHTNLASLLTHADQDFPLGERASRPATISLTVARRANESRSPATGCCAARPANSSPLAGRDRRSVR
jgi:tetratricopeptide (TPR) repeat protein